MLFHKYIFQTFTKQNLKKRGKQISSLGLALALIIGLVAPMTALAAGTPNLVINSQYKMPTYQAGEEIRLVVPVRNDGNGDAYDVTASLAISTDPKAYPFEIDRMVPKHKSSMIYAGSSEDVALRLTVSTQAESKIYPLTLNLEYNSYQYVETKDASGNIIDFSRQVTSHSSSETIYVKIENNLAKPEVRIHQTLINNEALATGQTGRVKLDLKNEGKEDAKDVKITLTGFSPSTMYMDGLNRPTQTLDILEAAHFNDTMAFDITVNSDLSTGIYNITASIEYKDKYDQAYKKETTLYIPVEKASTAKDSARLVLENIKYPTSKVAAEADFQISFTLRNQSNQAAENIKVNVDGGSEILPKSMSIVTIDRLDAGASRDLTFTLFSRESSETRNYPIQLTTSYDTARDKGDDKLESQSFSQYVGVLIKGKDKKDEESGKMAPKLILDNYQLDREYTQAGEDFKLNIDLLNTHSSQTIRNITVNFTADGDVFSPVNSSNTFYIDAIGAKGKINRELTLKPKIDAEFRTHNLNLDINYEDTDGKSYTARESIGIPVMQEIQLEITELEYQTEVMSGNPLSISTQFYNTGRATIRNLTIRLEGDFDTIDRSMYLGNIEPGKTSYYDVTITPQSEGELKGKVVFDFLDAIDNRHTIERDFTLMVTEWFDPWADGGMEWPDDGYYPDESGFSFDKKYLIYGGIGLILLAGAGFYIYRRRKMKKDLEDVELYD